MNILFFYAFDASGIKDVNKKISSSKFFLIVKNYHRSFEFGKIRIPSDSSLK